MINLHRAAFWVLVAFVFVMPWERNVPIPGAGGFGTPFAAIALALALASFFAGDRLKIRSPSVVIVLMGLFVLWSITTYFWSINPPSTLARSATYAQLLVMVWLIWQLVQDKQDFLRLLQAYVAGALFAVGVVLLGFLRGEAYHIGTTGMRFSFGGGDPNYLALTLALALPMAWYLFVVNKGKFFTPLNVLYIPVALLTIMLTGSRGGIVAAAIAFSAVPMTYWRLSIARKVILIGTLGAAVYAGVALTPDATIQRLLSIPEDVAEERLAGRQNIWQAGFVYLSANESAFIIGAGSGNFRNAIEGIYGRGVSAHNAYFNVLVENGVVGLVLFLAFFALALAPNVSAKVRFSGVWLALWLSLAVGIFALSWEREKPLWFVVGLLSTQRSVVISPWRAHGSASTGGGDRVPFALARERSRRSATPIAALTKLDTRR